MSAFYEEDVTKELDNPNMAAMQAITDPLSKLAGIIGYMETRSIVFTTVIVVKTLV